MKKQKVKLAVTLFTEISEKIDSAESRFSAVEVALQQLGSHMDSLRSEVAMQRVNIKVLQELAEKPAQFNVQEINASLREDLAKVSAEIRRMNEMLAYLREGVILDDATKLVLHEQAQRLRRAARGASKLQVPSR